MSRLLPYETILKAREGDPEAVNAVLLHYAGYIRYALLDGYRDFLEQQLTHNRRSLTETEILDIQNRCEQLYDLCGE